MQKVFFAVPTYGSQPCIEFQLSALATNNLLLQHGIQTLWRYKAGDPYVHKARNTLGSDFLVRRQDYDTLFFLDDDLGWEAEAVLRAVLRPEDVIAGVYPKKSDYDEFPVEMQFDADTKKPIEQNGLYLASMAATGFMRIKRHVLEKVASESMQYPENDLLRGHVQCWDMFRTGTVPNSRLVSNYIEFRDAHKEGYTQYMDPAHAENDALLNDYPLWVVDPKNGKWWGEDFFFSVMVRQLGFDVWVDPDINFTHRGGKAWEARFRHTLDEKIEEMSGGRRVQENTPAIKRYGEPSELGALVGMAFDEAMAGNSELPREILTMDGMSGRKYRMFVNNLMRLIDCPQYMEIGSLKGSTAVSACHDTMAESVTCIDNWEYFDGPREEFKKNMTEWVGDFSIHDADFRAVDYNELPSHNVFFYDGPHRERDHYDAMRITGPALDDEYVLIVDDWNWEATRNGTLAGLKDSGQRILSAIEVRPVQRRTSLSGQNSDWYNGYLIAVVRKNETAALAEAAE